jgi:NAD(P)-dependent dehydrogenase (short-subunit alcohol dehydrogenase family)
VSDGVATSLKGRGVVIVGPRGALAAAVEKSIHAAGGIVHAFAYRADGSATVGWQPNEDAIDAIFDEAVDAIGEIHGAVVIQRSLPQISLLEAGPDEWWEALRWNLRLPFLAGRRVLEEFLACRADGRLVLVGGYSAAREPHVLAATCETGLVALARTFMKEIGRRNVIANTVLVPRDWLADDGDSDPAREAAADPIRFLLSSDASFVNGNELRLGLDA